LFLILLVLLGYALNTGAFPQAARFLFHPDFSQITGTGILIAMGQAFFTLSLGMGAIMVYGSYLSERSSIAGTTFIIALADTLVALLAGLAIFPIVFANGLQPGEGAALIFVTLPIAFGTMPYGAFFGSLFFVLLVFAAWSSAISLMEPTVAWLVEKHAVNRVWASALTGLTCWLVGLVSLFSFNIWSGYQWHGKTAFDLIDFLATNVMLPVGGLLIAVFAGRMMSREATAEELGGRGVVYASWSFLIRYITPIAVAIVFLHAVYDFVSQVSAA
jgi:NSS family neurotransmitter:Na+ symporter